MGIMTATSLKYEIEPSSDEPRTAFGTLGLSPGARCEQLGWTLDIGMTGGGREFLTCGSSPALDNRFGSRLISNDAACSFDELDVRVVPYYRTVRPLHV